MHDLPVIHDEDAVAHQGNLAELARIQEDRRSVRRNLPEEVVDLGLGLNVDPSGRVEAEENVEILNQPSPDRDLLPVSSGEPLNLARCPRVDVETFDGSADKLTFVFANGVKMYHGGAQGGRMSFKGTDGECIKAKGGTPPNKVHIPNYKGRGGLIGDFLHCVQTRERPFRDIEIAHRAVSVCHLGNIAYWLKRRIKWDPVKEEIIGDKEASRWLDRPMREPYALI